MGRWAQRARRGGGPPPLPLPRLLSVDADGSVNLTLTFDLPVSTTPNSPTGTFKANLNNTANAAAESGTVIHLVAVGPVDAGDTYLLNGQPFWCLTPLAFPRSGTCV
jgi:hypothetical protein